MSTVGRDIENAIQSLLSVSEEYASIQYKLDLANRDLNMLETLYSATKYIGSDQDAHIVLTVLEDTVKGVFGANSCHVVFDEDQRPPMYDKKDDHLFDVEAIKNSVEDILVIEDVKNSEVSSLDTGYMLVLRLNVGSENYGFLICHWMVTPQISSSSKLFLQILSSQVSMYLKSARLVNEFKEMAVLDPLTGIYNRSYFSNIEATTLPSKDESIIMFDIDKFKRINDTKGHQFGDEVLKTFAEILTNESQDKDTVAFKYGGEEFIIKCTGGSEKALSIAENIRLSFKEKTGYTVSAGISTMGVSCNIASYRRLIRQADDAMYVSKQCGRDRITLSSSDIQLQKLAGISLANLVSKSFRRKVPTSIFRFKPKKMKIINERKFSKLEKEMNNIARVYDEIFVTDSLDTMLVIHGEIDREEFVGRLKSIFKKELKEFGFEIFLLDEVYKEVIIHSSRVSELSQILGAELGLSNTELNKIRLACEWHDVGKICTDPEVYGKKSPLTDEEYEVIKKHSWLSYSIAEQHPKLSEFSHWILYHHEDFNGQGYFGLTGIEIPFPAQIISLIDKFDALTEDRCYRPAYTWQKAVDILRSESQKFDVELFSSFENLIKRLMTEKVQYSIEEFSIS